MDIRPIQRIDMGGPSQADFAPCFVPFVRGVRASMTISDKINFANAVIASVSAIIALGYTVVTFHILRTSRDQLRALTQPYIQISPQIRT